MKPTALLRRASLLTVLALLAPLAASAQERPQGPPPADVRVAEALMRQMAPQIRVPGTVVSRHDSRIAAEISGRFVFVADVGAMVAAGQTLARIDDRMLQLERAENRSRVKRLQARLAYEHAQVSRYEALAASDSTPQARLEEAVAERDMIAEELAQARIALQRTELQIERTEVRAPFPGQVVERLAQAGEYSSPGAPVVRLVDTAHTEVRAQVPLDMAGSLVAGAPLPVTANGHSGPQALRAVIAAGNAVTRTMEVRVGAPEGLAIGAAVEVGIPAGPARQVVAVPRDALILRPGATYVWTVGEDERAVRVDVTPGAGAGELIAVDGEIAAGARIVVRGGERLRPGQPLKIGASALGS